MEPFTTHSGLVVPLDRANVDTDAIIPKQFLKSIHRTGFGPYLFDAWRYADGGGEPGQDCKDRSLNESFELNQPRYRGASILLTRDNFGCGSSREHAVWALRDYGIRCLIAPGFADIFYGNCAKNGVLAVTLSHTVVDTLFQEVRAKPGYRLDIDLIRCLVVTPVREEIQFDIDGSIRARLLEGLDDIGATLRQTDAIRDYERRRAVDAPWLFPDRSDS